MSRKRTWLLFLLVVLARLLTQGWDSGLLSPHPDERQVAFVAESAHGWFSDPGFYAYGSLHFHAVRAFAALRGLALQYDGLIRGGRTLSLLASVLAIFLGWLVARRAWGDRTARLFVLLAAFVPLDIQQSHFATVEAHHALWVTAALAACWWLAEGGGGLAAAVVGLAAGASLAVKVASLGLVLPLAVALLLVALRRGPLEASRLAAIAAATTVLAFWLGQPWAFAGGRPPLAFIVLMAAAGVLLTVTPPVDGVRRIVFTAGGVLAAAGAAVSAFVGGPLLNPAYLRGVGEQVAMVAGRADLAYIRVYRHTLPVLYPLRELGLWGLGPALLLATLAAVVLGFVWQARRWRRWLAGRWSSGAALVVVLLAWVVPMAARLATLQVKYLRYWEPLVVPGVLLAAWLLARLRRGRIVRTAVVVLTVVWGVAYLWAFAEPHPHRTAASFLNGVISKGDTVAFETWDEHVDVRVSGPRVELPSYELPDDDAKVTDWCRRLAKADWVVLTSNRVWRTVVTNRERFPRTARLYKLLLSGQAGFLPLTTVHREPHIFGLRLPVQLADESFVNYDFPEVVILRRVEEVDPEELASRSSRPLPGLEALGVTSVALRLVGPLPEVVPAPGRGRQLTDVVVWLLVFLGLGSACWVLLLPLLESWADGGAGLALVTGWLGVAWVAWCGSELGLWPSTPATASWLFLLLLAAAALVGWRRRHRLRRVWRARRRAVVVVAVVAGAVWLLFLAVRASNPAIFWGEKPMDFSFLNAFLRARAWPPGEPWMAGLPLHYYYFGEVLAALPIQLAGVSAAVGYNLMAATVPALAAALLASLGLAIRRRPRHGAWLLPLLVLLTGNLAWPWLMNLAKAGRWFDMWWATSRVIPGFAIDEYPLWTALFADLHAHFLALPVMLSALAWGWWTVRIGSRRWPAAAALCGLSVAVLAATNPWDVLVLTVALGVAALVVARPPLGGVARLTVAAAVSVVAALPFLTELAAWLHAGVGGGGFALNRQDFAPAWAVARHFGVFLLPLLVGALAAAGTGLWFAVPFAAAGAVVGLAFHSSAAAAGLASAAILVAAWWRERDPGRRLAWALGGLAMVLVAVVERFTLVDRMNTLFKTYNGVWLLLAAALAIVLLRPWDRRRTLVAAVWIPLELVALVNLPLGMYQGWAQPHARSPRPTLDGEAFLRRDDAQTLFFGDVLRAAARPGDVLAEAAGPSYREYTRLCMHTGLPTVVGWQWHLEQRGQDPREVRARQGDLVTLYAGDDPSLRRRILEWYHVRWIALGDIERRTYHLRGDDPFADVPGVVEVAHQGPACLYLVLACSAQHPAAVSGKPLPAGLTPVVTLTTTVSSAIRTVSAGAGGGAAVLGDGSVWRFDADGASVRAAPPPPCSPLDAVVWRSSLWSVCTGGELLRLADGAWTRLALGRPLRGLAADGDVLWTWGRDGLSRTRNGTSWERVLRGNVVTAAVSGDKIAWSDGSVVWRRVGDRRLRLPVLPAAVRQLAWLGPHLWALAGDGVYRSGGAILPWQEEIGGGRVAAISGRGDRLWLALDGGTVAEKRGEPCASPWDRGQGTGLGSLAEPRGIAVSPDGWFAVADTMHDRIQRFTRSGSCLGGTGSKGQGPGQFREPSGLALAPDGTLAVADTWNGRIQLLRPDGRIEEVGSGLFSPRAVLWGSDGSLWVADTGNKQIFRYTPPGWERRRVAGLPGPVVGLAWTGDRLAAAVPVAAEVVLLDPESGKVVRRLSVPGWSGGKQQEGYLLTLPSGELLATAPDPGELWLLDPSGSKPSRKVREGLRGLTSIARWPDGALIGSLTWESRLVRIRTP